MERDKYGQMTQEWTIRDYELLQILEEIDGPVEENEDKTLSAYMTDIIELLEGDPTRIQ